MSSGTAPGRSAHLSLALLACFVVTGLTACSPETPEADAPDAEASNDDVATTDDSNPDLSAASRDSLRDRFIRRGLAAIGETRREIRSVLGPPDSVAASAVPNRHVPGETDSIFHLHHDGLTARIHRVYDGRELLSQVAVRDDRHLREAIIGIGMPWREVRERIGEPAGRRDGAHVYECESCGVVEEPVLITVRDDTVAEIRFTYYVD